MNNVLFLDAISEIKSSPHFMLPQKRFKKALLPLVAVSCLVLSLLFMTGVRVGTYIQGYSIAKLEQQQNDLLSQLQAYKLEEAVLKRPERIRRMARELHMRLP